MSEMSLQNGRNAQSYTYWISSIPLQLFLLGKQRRSGYLLRGRELTLSCVQLRFNGPKTAKQMIALKCIPTEHGPFL